MITDTNSQENEKVVKNKENTIIRDMILMD